MVLKHLNGVVGEFMLFLRHFIHFQIESGNCREKKLSATSACSAVKRLQNVTGCMHETDINNRLYALIHSFMAECAACGVCRIVFSSIHKQKKPHPHPNFTTGQTSIHFPQCTHPSPITATPSSIVITSFGHCPIQTPHP